MAKKLQANLHLFSVLPSSWLLRGTDFGVAEQLAALDAPVSVWTEQLAALEAPISVWDEQLAALEAPISVWDEQFPSCSSYP